MLSDIDIKDILYVVIKDSPLEAAVVSKGGKLYKDERPTNSTKEDIIISVLDGLNGQYQTSVPYVNIYVPDVKRGDDYIENTQRLRELSRLASQLLEKHVGNEFRFEIEKQKCIKVNGAKEHCITNRLLFINTNF